MISEMTPHQFAHFKHILMITKLLCFSCILKVFLLLLSVMYSK